MVQVMHLYVDDSGTRHPDRKPKHNPAHNRDWFSLGGVLIRQEDEAIARTAHAEFMGRWELDPDEVFLHSWDIRHMKGDFTWLAGRSEEERNRFIEDLYQLMARPPFTGFACVIDRPGYDARYLERYGRQRWMLCKTAFSVLLERAAKHARKEGYKLKVFVEKGDPDVDRTMKGYYADLRSNGMPFDGGGNQIYKPLTASEFNETLYEFRTKNKSSPIMQLADIYLWPMSMGGYHRSNITYARLKKDGKLIDCSLSDEAIPYLGIKYSCFEKVKIKP
ncbi:MAG TPA: DUF3800 domain-containing protein [Azospirillaceae bacterium]|nr:DUF3800 domain-containing protein [Azospirillaceae bacterium]